MWEVFTVWKTAHGIGRRMGPEGERGKGRVSGWGATGSQEATVLCKAGSGTHFLCPGAPRVVLGAAPRAGLPGVCPGKS